MILFSATAFISAFLLFAIQPLFAKMALPLLGGTPAVWNTCMVFYQALLLAGYYYAHYSTTHWKLNTQVIVHALLLLVASSLLPIQLPAGWAPPVAGNPILSLLIVMALAMGLPFFAISASAPLLQRWFSYTKQPSADNPYWLYAASNCGSFLALISYPFLIERYWRLATQSALWSAGYWLLLGLFLASAAATWANRRSLSAPSDSVAHAPKPAAETITWQRQLRWVLLAFVPSSLMLGVTTYISTDIASFPLLWVIPLGLYLLTFIIVFSEKPIIAHTPILRLIPPLMILIGVTITSQALRPTWLVLGLHLLLFFVIAMACHGELAHDRPSPQQLTRFYLLMSLGGACGGIFNSLLAPLLFAIAAEYPIAMILACLLLPEKTEEGPSSVWQNRLDYLWPIIMGFLVLSLSLALPLLTDAPMIIRRWLLIGLPPLLCYPFRNRRVRFALCIGSWLLASALVTEGLSSTLAVRRSFFGIYTVREEAVQGRLFHRLMHGTTLHGMQDRDPVRRQEPIAYYTRQGPFGQVIDAYQALHGSPEVAALGLGTGTVACYAQPGQAWTFYEIDATVKEIAQNPKLFSYLERCSPSAAIILGDARLSLARSPDRRFGLIIADTFSSDSIPMHLITREAFALYFSKLDPHGLLVMNISNRYLDLGPVIGNITRSLGLVALLRENRDIAPEDFARGTTGSIWVVVARRLEDLAPLARNTQWKPAPIRPEIGAWTDDFANIVGVLRLNR